MSDQHERRRLACPQGKPLVFRPLPPGFADPGFPRFGGREDALREGWTLSDGFQTLGG